MSTGFGNITFEKEKGKEKPAKLKTRKGGVGKFRVKKPH